MAKAWLYRAQSEGEMSPGNGVNDLFHTGGEHAPRSRRRFFIRLAALPARLPVIKHHGQPEIRTRTLFNATRSYCTVSVRSFPSPPS